MGGASVFPPGVDTLGVTPSGYGSNVFLPGPDGSTHEAIHATLKSAVQSLEQQALAANTISLATIADLRIEKVLSASISYALQGYLAPGDGGGGAFLWNPADTAADNGGTVIQVTGVATGRFNRIYIGDIYGAWFGALPGIGDVTSRFQSATLVAIATGLNLRLIAGSYTLNGSVYLANAAPYTQHVPSVIGVGRVYINQINLTAYCLVIDMDGGQDVNLYDWTCENLTFNTVFGVACGLAEMAGSQFGGDGSGQCPLKGMRFVGCDFEGTYLAQSDPNIDTDVVPSLASLKAYGVAIKLSKCFDVVIDDCNLNGFGIGVTAYGSDLCEIRGGRIISCARWIYTLRIGTFGSQLLTQHVDLLANRRIYGIYLDGTYWDEILSCYFETYTPAACWVYGGNNFGTLIADNRFDDSGQLPNGTPFMSFAPLGEMIVRGNRWNPSTPTPVAIFSSTNWSSSFPQLCLWLDNSSLFPVPDYPQVRTQAYNQLLWNHRNNFAFVCSAISGWPWVLAGAEALTWAIQSTPGDNNNIAISMPIQDPTARAYQVRMLGRYVNGPGTIQITYAFNGAAPVVGSALPLGFTNSGDFQAFEYLLTLPNNGSGDLTITLTFNTHAVQLASIELIPAYFCNYGSAILGSGGTGGSVTIADPNITADSLILTSRAAAGGTLGHLSYALNPTVGFTLNSSSDTDTSTVVYFIQDQQH